jgi:hypothetical protein
MKCKKMDGAERGEAVCTNGPTSETGVKCTFSRVNFLHECEKCGSGKHGGNACSK